MCGRLQALVSLHSCRHLLPAALTSACVLVPVAREVAFGYMLFTSSTSSGCGSSALERPWHCLVLLSAQVSTTKDTSLALLVMDAAEAEGRRALASRA
jgi:hypothetical protein